MSGLGGKHDLQSKFAPFGESHLSLTVKSMHVYLCKVYLYLYGFASNGHNHLGSASSKSLLKS